MSRTYHVADEDDRETVENALDAVDDDPDLPPVDRSRGRTTEGHLSTGEALAKIAEAFTGWSA